MTYDLHRESDTIVECASFQWKTKPIFNISSTSNENKLLMCWWSRWGDLPAYNRWPWLGLLCDLSLTPTNPYSLMLDNSTFEWPLDSNKLTILGGVCYCGGVFVMELNGYMLINHKFLMPSLYRRRSANPHYCWAILWWRAVVTGSRVVAFASATARPGARTWVVGTSSWSAASTAACAHNWPPPCGTQRRPTDVVASLHYH